MFGLGKWASLRVLLSKLFHLPDADTEDVDPLASRSNHSSGEKSPRESTTSGVASKASERRAKNSKKAAAFKTNSADGFDGSSSSSCSHGVNLIYAGTSKVRTEMDASRFVAEVDSAECALGLLILDVWCDYFDHIARYCGRAEKTTPLSEANKDKLYTILVELGEFSTQVRTSLDVSTLVMGPTRKSKSQDMDTLAERGVKRATARLDDLAARVYGVFVACAGSVDESNDLVHDVLDLDGKLEVPAQWISNREESDSQWEKYVQGQLSKAWPLLEAAMRPWGAVTVPKIAVRYSVAQLRCVLAQLTQNLSDVQELGVKLSELEDSAVLRKTLASLSRTLGQVLSHTKILLYARAPSAAGVSPPSLDSVGVVDVNSRQSALWSVVDLLSQPRPGTGPASRKPTEEDALVEVVDHMRRFCSLNAPVSDVS